MATFMYYTSHWFICLLPMLLGVVSIDLWRVGLRFGRRMLERPQKDLVWALPWAFSPFVVQVLWVGFLVLLMWVAMLIVDLPGGDGPDMAFFTSGLWDQFLIELGGPFYAEFWQRLGHMGYMDYITMYFNQIWKASPTEKPLYLLGWSARWAVTWFVLCIQVYYLMKVLTLVVAGLRYFARGLQRA